MTGRPAPGVFNVSDVRAAARRRLPRSVFEFIDRGTEDEVALANNRLAFERIRIRPRAAVRVVDRTQEVELLGRTQAMPIGIAPTGAAGLVWHNGELALARAAAEANVPFILATGSLTPMEEIAQVARGRFWLQLYRFAEWDVTAHLLERAKALGWDGLVVTVDTAALANREYNARNGFGLPFRATGRTIVDGMLHPRWMATVLLRYVLRGGLPVYANLPPDFAARITRNAQEMRLDSLCWDDIREIRRLWPGKLIVKGILRADDAVTAAECGADGIIVSNHGGRNLDCAVAPIDALPDVVAAVGGSLTVMMDSGIRRGSDVLKALALGARTVFVGRPTLYGTAIGGQAGAMQVLAMISRELDLCMAFSGCRSVAEIGADLVFPAQGGREEGMDAR